MKSLKNKAVHSVLKTLLVVVGIAATSLYSGCRTDFNFRPINNSELRFSSDTVYLDTIFTGISSATYSLKVYNTSDDAVSIPNIYLDKGDNSNFRLNVDGLSGKSFQDVELLPKDSMYVYIETTADINELTQNNTQFLYEDTLHFSDVGEVILMTLVQDAVFLYPNKNNEGIKESIPIGIDDKGNTVGIVGRYLADNELIFTKEKPYVVYGYMGVPSGKTAVFEAGARIYFHENSGIIVGNNATIVVNGEPSTDPEAMEGEVIFEGDRLESLYENIPGQWGAIWLTTGSTQHQFNHATIKNATVGILMDYNDETANPTLTIKNTQIHNSAAVNLWGKTAHIYAENSVFSNAGQVSFHGNIGGNYHFVHCTFANYWNKSFRSTPAVLLNDYTSVDSDTNFIKPLEKATFDNCIIEGNQFVEFYAEQVGTGAFNFKLNHTALQFDSSNQSVIENPFFDWENSNYYNNIIRNGTPSFILPEKNDMRISQKSDFIQKGDTATGAQVPTDLLGTQRTSPPDLGAYQHVEIED
ncbi:MAG: hypothetical protein O2810_00895 [Bacteroidetes bacterium]|nr:hypothetical protein [Bacteroidota bacterium]MDA0888124.1 hypothetical protein [Bacteroidota bacterium]MDA1084076.1 hypothetical protein [Bacteroidota bacterium]